MRDPKWKQCYSAEFVPFFEMRLDEAWLTRRLSAD